MATVAPEHLDDVAKALCLIEEAQMRLYAATRFLSRVPGLATACNRTGKHADATKKLWEHIEWNNKSLTGTCNLRIPQGPHFDC